MMKNQPLRGQRKLELLEKLNSDPCYVVAAYRQAFGVAADCPLPVKANPRLVEQILEREYESQAPR